MSLENDINTLKAKVAEQVPPDVLSIIGEETNLLARSGVADKSLKAGDKAPVFFLPNSQSAVVSSQDLLAKGPLVVTFYRGGW
jgi:hypothetical protein